MGNKITEVEKLYRNAGINMCTLEFRTQYTTCDYNTCNGKQGKVSCGWYVVPPLAPEKQLELIKWLSTKELKIRTNKQPYAVYVGVLGNDSTCFYGCEGLYLEQTLSELINYLWQDLTEQEKKEIRGILEED